MAIDGRHRDLRKPRKAIHELGLPCGQRLRLVRGERRHLHDVVAGAERPAAPEQHDDAHVVHRGHALDGLLQRGRERAVQRVERLGAREREPHDAIGLTRHLDERHGLA